MCGFLGNASRFSKNYLELCDKYKVLNHRGPDNNGIYIDKKNKIFLSHCRLKIQDLSEAGAQPMNSSSGRFYITFNGEIYNFKKVKKELENEGFLNWKGKSDTEVLLAAIENWGLIFTLKKIIGMFSFALYDQYEEEIFLVRDISGEKPMFYRADQSEIYFASELKALINLNDLPQKIDQESLHYYLGMGFVPGNKCILEGYNKLPAGNILKYSLNSGDYKLIEYWDLPNHEESQEENHLNDDDIVNELETLLDDSVKMQLEADVPVGILLSGGLDSSLVTAFASRHKQKLKTFSVVFPNQSEYDESNYSKLIAKYFSTEHTELNTENLNPNIIKVLAKQFDEPIIDSSMIPTFLLSKTVREHCAVAMGGDGADEIFAGYKHYSRLIWMKNNLKSLPYPLKKYISKLSSYLPIGFKGLNWIKSLKIDLNKEFPLIAYYFDQEARSKLLNQNLINSVDSFDKQFIHSFKNDFGILQEVTRFDFKNYLCEDILVKIDRASMLNSLELRSPFLDRRVIDFAFSRVPNRLRANQKERKIILKHLAKKLLPSEFDPTRKQGFKIPLKEWLKEGEFREFFWDTLKSKDCFFNQKFINNLLDAQDKGYNNEEKIFALVLFQIWKENYQISI